MHETLEEKRDDIADCEPGISQKGVSRLISPREKIVENTSSLEQGGVVTAAPETGLFQANSATSYNQTTPDTKPPDPSRKLAKRHPPAKAESKSRLQQEQVLPNTTSGHPQRKAKQTALAKLRSTNIETDDDELAHSDGEPESDASMVFTKKTRNSVTRRVEEGEVKLSKSTAIDSLSKQKETGLPSGKLRSMKANRSISKADAKTEVANARATPEDGPNGSFGECKGDELNKRELQASTKTKRTAPRSRHVQDRSQPSKRPGMLKRPARSASRGRKSVRDQHVYDVTENAAQTTRSKRSLSKASRPPRAKIQPTRQRMQAQSTKERPRQASVQQTNLRRPLLQERVGSSHNNAILIHQSDRSRSCSSSRTSTQSEPATAEASHTACVPEAKGRLHTPFVVPSSPPGPMKRSEYTPVFDKPTIIAFGRTGPQNQGSASLPKDVSSKHNSSDGEKRSKFLLIRDATNVSAKTPFPADMNGARKVLAPTQITKRLKNTDTRNKEVFSSFMQNGKNTALAKMLGRDCEAGGNVHRLDAADDERDVDPLCLGDDFEGPTLVEEDRGKSFAHKLRTASQVAMPPPKRAALKHKTGSRERQEAEVFCTAHVSDIHEADRTSFESLRSTYPPLRMEDQDMSSPEKCESHSAQMIRKRGTDNFPEPVSKKAKSLQTNQERNLDRSDSPGLGNYILEPPNVGDTALAKHDQGAAQKRDRRTRRSASNSNGVDLLGSPYPKNLHVPKQATALEVFSQQTGLSSDRPSVPDDREFPGPLIFAPLPTAQSSIGLRHRLSNEELRSSADQETSKSLTRNASGPVTQRLLKANPSIKATDNPFITSHTQKPTKAGPMSELAEKLRRRGFTSSDENMDDDQPLEEDDDPDKTLLDRVDDRDDGLKAITSSPASSKASDSSTTRYAEKIIEDVGDWRNALKPHQTRLFDSLVIASHKLVRHLVDRDTADRDIVADYRRRGEIIVTELQQAQAREYELYLSRMQVWKQQAADKLEAYAKELGKRAKDSERAKIERQKAKRSWNEVQSVFSRLLEG